MLPATYNTNQRLEMIGSAAAGIAHDINNQLTLILNHLAMPDLEGARKAVTRCSALTSGLLSYCRGESLNLRPLDIAALVRDFVRLLILPPEIRLVVEVPSMLPEVMGDAVALTRVLTNLVGNACEAMKGSGILRIVASARTIEVIDDGPGISTEDMKKVFEPFFTTKGSLGTGLGLAIVREIMRQHGGAAIVKSEIGQGAQFQLRFSR